MMCFFKAIKTEFLRLCKTIKKCLLYDYAKIICNTIYDIVFCYLCKHVFFFFLKRWVKNWKEISQSINSKKQKIKKIKNKQEKNYPKEE